MLCICGKELDFTGKIICECSECGRKWGRTSAGNLSQMSRPTKDAPDGAKAAATLSGLYNCQVCGQEKCAEPGICDDCLAPPTEFEINHWDDDDPTPLVI